MPERGAGNSEEPSVFATGLTQANARPQWDIQATLGLLCLLALVAIGYWLYVTGYLWVTLIVLVWLIRRGLRMTA